MVARPVVLSLMLAAVAGCGDGGPTAPSLPQPTGFGTARSFSTHVAIDATFPSGGRTVPGLLLLPPGAQPHPVLVLVRGSERWTRVDYEPFTANFVSRGYGVFSYDKAAAGDFDRFADDAAAAARLIGGHPRVTRVGFYGFSEGGWVVPLAATRHPGLIAFTVMASGPAVSTGEDLVYDALTGIATCTPTGLTEEEIDTRMAATPVSGFDPRPHIEAMITPGLWQYCLRDHNIPARQSVAVLEHLRQGARPITIQTFRDCNHNFIAGGAMCQLDGPRVDWVTPMFAWLDAHAR